MWRGWLRSLLGSLLGSLVGALLGSAIYGYAVGSAHSDLYAARDLAKFPLLIAVTALVCTPSYWIAARALGAPLGFTDAQRCVWRVFRDASMLLASLSPVVFFLARAARATDDGRLGEYDAFLALNMAFVAAAGAIALLRQARALFERHALARARAVALVAAWLALSSFVGGQAAFFMRPFFGFPATRGNVPPWFLGSTPDVRGATNFYEAVAQSLRRPDVERWPWERY